MSGEIDIKSPEVQEFLQLLAEILAEKFIEEQKTGEAEKKENKLTAADRQ